MHLALSHLLRLHRLSLCLECPSLAPWRTPLHPSKPQLQCPLFLEALPGPSSPCPFPLAPSSLHRARGVCGFHHNDLGTLCSAPLYGSKDGSYSHLQDPPNSHSDSPTQSHMLIPERIPASLVAKGSNWPDLVTCPHVEPPRGPGSICPPTGRQGEYLQDHKNI